MLIWEYSLKCRLCVFLVFTWCPFLVQPPIHSTFTVCIYIFILWHICIYVSLGSSWLWQLLRLISLLITLKVLESAGQVFFQMFLSWNLSGVFSCLNCTDGLLEERSQRSSFLTTSCQGHHSLMTGHYWYHGPRTEVVLGGSALSQICSRMLWWWVLFLEITSIAFIHFSKRPGRQ